MAFLPGKVFRIKQGIMIIRSAIPADAGELLYFIHKVNGETDFLSRGPGEFNMSLQAEERFIAGMLASPRDILLIARLNGILAGTLGTNSYNTKRYRHKITFGISVLKDYWGLGIGKRLIKTMIDWADSCGIIKIALEVDTLNSRAINLYKSMGFMEEGLLKMDRRMENMEFRDSLTMARFNPYYPYDNI